ncbi:NAD-dependent epimerase/dehydratase family protein [Streptomyces sp. NPDC086787]|uniref:NAD-dependent epimerase/dehydratase family protein n=1 Tax=Streptomyces sp. NPDC086787 TaxID=3365759 RepID=UPI0038299614
MTIGDTMLWDAEGAVVRQVLVTGATGTVGGPLVHRLAAAGHRVVALLRSPDGAGHTLPAGVVPVRGDLTDPASLRSALEGCDTVFHTAGLAEQWLADPSVFDRVNVQGTRHLVEAALAAGVECFVHTSTIDVFERAPGRPFDESRLESRPLATAYERTKQDADRLVAAAVAERGLPARFVHPSAVYGPGRADATLNLALAQLARNQVPMLPPGGMPVVFAEDVAEGQLLAAGAPVGSRWILSDTYLTMREVARAVAAAVPGAKVPPTMPAPLARTVAAVGEGVSRITRRPPLLASGVLHFLRSHSVPDATAARTRLGWTATPFDKGLEATFAAR